MSNTKQSIPSRGWTLVLISWVVIAIANFSNLGIGMLIPQMREQFNLSLTTTGYFSTITFGVQVFLVIPVTLISTRVNPKYVLGIIFLCTSLAFFLHGFATGAPMLMVGRAFLAMGVTGITAPMAMVKDSWVPLDRMTTINGLEQFASTTGQALGTLGVTTLILLLGNWQNMMNVLGIIGAAATVLWFIFYKSNPDKPIKLTGGGSFMAPLKEACKEKSVWLLAVGWPGTTLVWIAFTTFWPTYATVELGLTLSQAGVAIGMIPVASAIACVASPPLTKMLGRDKWMIWPWGLILCLAYFGGTITSNFFLLCVTFFIAGFGAFAFVPIAFTTLFKLKTLSPGGISMGTSVILTLCNIGGALAGIVVGKLMDIMDLKTALMWCCLSPLLWFATTIFLPELGRKAEEKQAAAKPAGS